MEWFVLSVVGVMLLLLIYSIVSTSVVLNKKIQPHLDALFDGIYVLLRYGSKTRRPSNGGSKFN